MKEMIGDIKHIGQLSGKGFFKITRGTLTGMGFFAIMFAVILHHFNISLLGMEFL
jgi:hypothetical protein